jgi:hypothetical protein
VAQQPAKNIHSGQCRPDAGSGGRGPKPEARERSRNGLA